MNFTVVVYILMYIHTCVLILPLDRPSLMWSCNPNRSTSCAAHSRVIPLLTHPTRTPAYLPLLHSGVEHSSRTVSIIVVDTALCLLEDNYFQWPMSKLGHVSHTGMYTPPYKLIAKKFVTDISSVVSTYDVTVLCCMYVLVLYIL